ncbi:MAG TPA: hypothetical protein VIK29_08545 [Paludibacter sp.]
MEWYHYVCGLLAGAILANFVPHFVQGISGNRFHTPFAKPHGKGLSSPTLNVWWGLFNLVIGYLLFRFARVSNDDNLSIIMFLAGFSILSLLSSKGFATKHKE